MMDAKLQRHCILAVLRFAGRGDSFRPQLQTVPGKEFSRKRRARLSTDYTEGRDSKLDAHTLRHASEEMTHAPK